MISRSYLGRSFVVASVFLLLVSLLASVLRRNIDNPCAAPVSEVDWAGTSVAQVVLNDVPVVLKNSPVLNWAAFRKWSPQYLSKRQRLPLTNVQMSSSELIDFLDNEKALWDTPHWQKQLSGRWTQTDMSASKFFSGCDKITGADAGRSKYPYLFYSRELQTWDPVVRQDVPSNATRIFEVPSGEPHDVLVWMGCSNVTSRAHYDGVHNFYIQLFGRKRFLMSSIDPSSQDSSLLGSLYSYLDPRARQSTLRFASQRFSDANHHCCQLVADLGPGDVLYLPPYTFHEVKAEGTSISLSMFAQASQQWDVWLAMKSTTALDLFGDVKLQPLPVVTRLSSFLMHLLTVEKRRFPEETQLHAWSHVIRRTAHKPATASSDVHALKAILSSWDRSGGTPQIELSADLTQLAHRICDLLSQLKPRERALFVGHYVEWLVYNVLGSPHVVAQFLSAVG